MSVEAVPLNLATAVQHSPALGAGRLVSVTSPAPRDAWHRLMASDPDALPYQSPEWTDSAVATGKFADVSRLYETADGQQILLPLLARAGRPAWANLAVSMPESWGIGGPLSATPLTPDVLSAIIADLRKAGFLGVHLRPNPLHAALWQSVPIGMVIPRRAHVIDLAGGFDTVWGNFTGQVRRVIRKAERTVEVEFGATERLLPQFYGLLKKSWLRWAEAQHEPKRLALWRAHRRDPYHRFQKMLATMGDNCQIGVAYLGGELVAANIVLHGPNANYSRGAIDAERIGNSGANDLLQKLAIERAVNNGNRYYHMGESGWSSSLSQFKQKFGAVPYDYAEYRIERLPFTQADRLARTAVKRLIGFKDGA
jgi:hypothetical protein